MEKDKLIVIIILTILALFAYFHFHRMELITPYVEAYVEAIKISSQSYAPITSYNVPIFNQYNQWIYLENKPSTSSKWEKSQGPDYLIYKLDPDSHFEGLPNIEVELRIVGQEEKIIYNSETGKADTIVFNYILIIERISADYTEIGGVRFFGAERYGKYANSFIRIVFSSPYYIEEIVENGQVTPSPYVEGLGKNEVKYLHKIEDEAPGEFEKVFYSLVVLRCNKNIPLTPKTTITNTETRYIPTTLISYSTIVKPYTITATKQIIVYQTTTVINGITTVLTISTAKYITVPTTYTELKPYTITITLGEGSVVTVTDTITKTTTIIPDFLKDIPMSFLVIAAGIIIVIIAMIYRRRKE